MTLLAIPLCLLYFASGLFALIVDKRRNKNDIDNTGLSVIKEPEEI
jgi:sec-independent protein translocase protein TatC